MTAYEMRISDWSSYVCSSDLHELCLAREDDVDEAFRSHCLMPGGAVRPSVGERSQASCPLRRDPGRRDRAPDRANPAPIAPRNTPPPRCLAWDRKSVV